MLEDQLVILHEDNHIIVVLKPQNVACCPDESGDDNLFDCVKRYIKEKYAKPGNVFLGLVHRLDRPTGGVMVYAKTSKAAARLSEQLRGGGFEKRYLAVLCGTNERLKADIEAAGLANVRPVGYTKRVSLWMDAADLIISKPGGLTSSEAMAKRLPMIIVDAVPGCETKNLEYLTARGCARFVPVEDIPAAARELLLNAAEREEIRSRIEQNFPQGAAERITEALFGLAKGQSRG